MTMMRGLLATQHICLYHFIVGIAQSDNISLQLPRFPEFF